MATRIRQKAEKRAKNKDTRPFAEVKYVRMSPSKIRIVLDTVRGKDVTTALAMLENMSESAAFEAFKVLKSAVANAENNKGLNRDELYVAECYTTEGPRLRRMSPRAKGRGNIIHKRTAHIRFVLDVKA